MKWVERGVDVDGADVHVTSATAKAALNGAILAYGGADEDGNVVDTFAIFDTCKFSGVEPPSCGQGQLQPTEGAAPSQPHTGLCGSRQPPEKP